jgi:arsenate reductase (thioredoxin)
VKISQLAHRAGVSPTAVRWYERVGVLPRAPRGDSGYREYAEVDLARLRLVLSLRRLGLPPVDAGRLARLCLEHGSIDGDLGPLIASQRDAIARQRDDLDRLDAELTDLETTIDAAARVRGSRRETTVTQGTIRVLFVCTGNSARSQMGEALLEHLGGPAFEVESAGTQPKGVDPDTVRVLAEVGIDWSHARSKPLAPFVDQPFDYVITVCDRARQACPVFPGPANTLHWGLDDPAEVEGSDEQRLAAFRRTRQELAQRLRPFIEIARRSAGLPVERSLTG